MLRHEIGRLFSESPNQVAIAAVFDAKRNEYAVRVGGMPDKALEYFGLLIGDAVHNFRGALDHLVWQLALEDNGGKQPLGFRRVQFPIFDRAEAFKGRFPSLRIAPEHETTLARFQPYRGGHGKHLARLRELSNEDKHQVITPLVLVPHDYTPFLAATLRKGDRHRSAPTIENASRRGDDPARPLSPEPRSAAATSGA